MAVLKEINILETELYTADQLANVSSGSRATITTASFYTGIKGTQSTTSTNSDVKKKPDCVFCRGPHSPTASNVVMNYVSKAFRDCKEGKHLLQLSGLPQGDAMWFKILLQEMET